MISFSRFTNGCLLAVLALSMGLASPVFAAKKARTGRVLHPRRVATAWLYNRNRHYKDEKVDITNPTSKCNTKSAQRIHAQAISRAEQDGQDYGVSDMPQPKTDVEKAYHTYRQKLDLLWDGMQEPYCGYGAFGVAAALHSLDKGISRARGNFLKAAQAN